MTGAAKRKGDAAEREVARILTDLLGVECRRELGAGRLDDMGDIRLPRTVVQVANYRDIGRAIREKLPAAVEQQERAGALFGAVFVRRLGGEYVVCQTVAQWSAMWREAQ